MQQGRRVITLSIRSRQLLLLMTILLPALGIIVVSGLKERRQVLADARDQALLLAQSLAAQQEQMAAATREMLNTLAQLPAVQQLDVKACNEIFGELNLRNLRYSTIGLVSLDGNLLAASTPFKAGTVNLADRKHIRDAVATLDFSAGEYIVGRLSKVQSINYTYPVLNAENQLVAIVAAGLKLDEVARFLSHVKLPEDSVVSLADHRGVRLLRLPDSETAPPGRPIPTEAFELLSGPAEYGTLEHISADGMQRIYGYKRLRLKEGVAPYMYLTVGLPKEHVLENANAGVLKSLLVLGLAALLAAILSWRFGTLLVARPLQGLVAASRRFGKGEVASRTGLPHSADEFGQLAQAFDEMAELIELREQERERAEEALRETNAALETRVMQRTEELTTANAEYKRALEALRESEEKYRGIFDESVTTIYLFDINKNFIDANQAGLDLLGYSKEELLRMGIPDVDADAVVVLPAHRELLSGGRVINYEHRLRRKDGAIITVLNNSRALFDGSGNVVGMLSTLLDITERKRAEEALSESEEQFKAMFQIASIGMAQANPETGQWLRVNQKMCDITGYSHGEMLSLSVPEITHPEDRERDWNLFQEVISDKRKDYRTEKRYVRKDGSVVWVSVNMTVIRDPDGNPLRTFATIEDITERRRAAEARGLLESQLLHAQKLEAIGTLAGGIAHDFNNILSPIIGYTEMAMDAVGDSNHARFDLDQVLTAANRAKDLVRQILSFSRLGEDQLMQPVDVSLILKEALKLLRASLPSTIEIRPDIHKVIALADATQIHQVIVNLCTNAAHAMQDAGTLDVSLREVVLSHRDLLDSSIADIKPGKYLKLSVKDTGAGMSPDTVQRIFDPYFTTKEVGKGTGLGLAVVHGIVKRHGGEILVRSAIGKGSSFDVLIPVPELTTKREEAGSQNLPGGTERILLVDDEPTIARLEARILEQQGYSVTSKTSPEEALELFRSQPDQFDLIITDYTMPQMVGTRLAEECLRLRAEIPVIICTGYSERLNAQEADGTGVKAVVMKPLDRRRLSELVRKVLDESRTYRL